MEITKIDNIKQTSLISLNNHLASSEPISDEEILLVHTKIDKPNNLEINFENIFEFKKNTAKKQKSRRVTDFMSNFSDEPISSDHISDDN